MYQAKESAREPAGPEVSPAEPALPAPACRGSLSKGTAESSPGRESWLGFDTTEQSRQGRLRISQDMVLGILTNSAMFSKPRLASFSPSLRNSVLNCDSHANTKARSLLNHFTGPIKWAAEKVGRG